MDYVAGFTVVHDVSARDWQLKKNGGQWLIGKTFDSFCPMGPAIVTKDSLSGDNSIENVSSTWERQLLGAIFICSLIKALNLGLLVWFWSAKSCIIL